MKVIISLLGDNKIFFILYACFLIVCFPYVIMFPREHFLIYLNSINTPSLDIFFKYSTFLGDGLFILLIIFPLVFLRIRYAVLSVITYLVSGLISQIIKYSIQSPRPLNYLSNIENLHKVPGIEIYYYNSFPSGHSATAFAFFLLLAMITKNKNISFVFFLIALAVALSRIYLLQHFLVDVWAGSLVGVITTLVVFWIFENNKRINNSHWLNFSIYYRLKNK